MFVGWLFLALGVTGYGIAHFLQANAARTTDPHVATEAKASEPTKGSIAFIRGLVTHRGYWFGVSVQVFAAVCAVLARKDLPLFLVQAALASSVGLTALLGVVKLRWRLPRIELALLVAMAAGLTMLIASARGSAAKDLDVAAVAALAILPAVLGAASWFASRLRGAAGSAALGAIAGAAFSAAAVASRPLANSGSLIEVVTSPLLYILIVNAAIAQITLAHAFRHGSVTAAICAMDAAGAIPAAVIGLLLLGDAVRPGLAPLAFTGFILTIGAVLAMARFAEPQAHPSDTRAVAPHPRVPPARTPVAGRT